MRPLPDLTALDQQPSVWDQSTDDWNGIFANEFSGIDAQQQAANQTSAQIFPAMDPISAGIDALSGALDTAGQILDLLSGDLDAVNLDPIITDYQAADLQLDSSLAGQSLDFTGAATALLSNIEVVSASVAQFFDQYLWIDVDQMWLDLEQVWGDVFGFSL